MFVNDIRAEFRSRTGVSGMRLWYQLMASEKGMNHFIAATQALADRAAAPGTTVEVHGTREGAYGDQYRLFWHYNVREIIRNGLEAGMGGQYDAVVIANSLEPGMVELREILDIPVISFMEACCFTACTMGERFGLIVPNEKFVPRYREIVHGYGIASRLAAVEPLKYENTRNFNSAFIDPQQEESCAREIAASGRRAVEQGAEVLIAIGAATALMARRGVYEIDGAPLLDSYSLLVKLAEATVSYKALTGTFISRRGLYKSPPADLMRQAAEIHKITPLLRP